MLRGNHQVTKKSSPESSIIKSQVITDDNFYIKKHDSRVIKMEKMKQDKINQLNREFRVACRVMQRPIYSLEPKSESRRSKRDYVKGPVMVDFRASKIQKVTRMSTKPHVHYTHTNFHENDNKSCSDW